MKKPITLKHAAPNGVVFTRTTARPYTHVLLRAFNPLALIAEIEKCLPEHVAKARAEAAYNYLHWIEGKKAGIGGAVRWHRATGGYHLYGASATRAQPDYEYEFACKRITEFPTLETYVEHREKETRGKAAEEIAQWRTATVAFEVVSWHSRAELAQPKCPHPSDRYIVQQINGGVLPK